MYSHFAASHRLIFSSLLAVLCATAFAVRCEDRVVFSDSIKAVPAAQLAPVAARSSTAKIDFMVSLKMRNMDELQARIARGDIVSPAEMDAKYDPLQADYDATANWLAKQGLTVLPATGTSRVCIFGSGTPDVLQAAFQAQFGTVVGADGKTYTSAVTAPSLPATLAGAVLGINGLQPHLRPHTHSKPVSLAGGATVGPRLNNAPPYYPKEILKTYNADTLTVTGSGQKIGIIIDTFANDADMTAFWTTTGTNQSLNNIEKVQVVAGNLPAASGEETLDTQTTSSMAPGALIRVYAASDLQFVHLDQCYNAVINDLPTQPLMHQLSLSYGANEVNLATNQLQTDALLFTKLVAAGVTVFVSTGDGGSTPGPKGFQDNSGPLSVEHPACDVNCTAVGGTTLTLSASGAVGNEIGWTFGGGGRSIAFTRPSWQVGASLPTGTDRLLPDVASAADADTGILMILNGKSVQEGGTSWSAPMWAGFCALINNARANAGMAPVGLLGPKIYPLLGTSSFRDITAGNNGYAAGAGYDLSTGLGVPNMANLVAALTVGGTPPVPNGENLTLDTTIGISGPDSIRTGQSMTVSAGITNNGKGDAGAFTVRFSLSTDTKASPDDTVLGDASITGLKAGASTTASWTGPCPKLASGSYSIIVNIDANNQVAETNENDNLFYRLTPLALVSNRPPVIVSGPTFVAPAFISQPVSFSVAATDPDNDQLSAAWDFGDGTTGTGGSPTHSYDNVGTFTVKVTVSDGNGGSVTGTVSVKVFYPVYSATLTKKKFSLNFRTNVDSIDVTVSHPRLNNLSADGSDIFVYFGNVFQNAPQFDSGSLFKNKAAGADGKFTLTPRQGTIRYAATRTFIEDFMDTYGASDADVTKTVTVPVYIFVNNAYYGGNYTFFYTGKSGRSGMGK